MKRSIAALAFAVGTMLAIPAMAQDLETVVVTGMRASDEAVPEVTLIRRADHIITQITISCDTRDSKMRADEMKQTLLGLLREAGKTKGLSLSVPGRILRDFTADRIPDMIVPDSRPDTSRSTIIVKTPISKGDTYESATGRIEDFVKRAPRVGRSLISADDEWQLTIVGPQQYHLQVVQKVAKYAKEVTALFGPDYGVQVEGLQRPVEWYRSGQLDLALYISYSMTIMPRKTP
jgi:hypothetical protein